MWGLPEELLAQLIEEVSVLVADRRRRKPREVTRPEWMQRASKRNAKGFQSEDGSVRVRGHAQMKAYAAARMGVGTA